MTLLRRMSCQKPTTRSMDGRVVDSVGYEDHGPFRCLNHRTSSAWLSSLGCAINHSTYRLHACLATSPLHIYLASDYQMGRHLLAGAKVSCQGSVYRCCRQCSVHSATIVRTTKQARRKLIVRLNGRLQTYLHPRISRCPAWRRRVTIKG
jgi:hypothetical protein